MKTACRILEAVGPALTGLGVLFKAPTNLLELRKLNCGLFYGTSQIGKFLTVYPVDSNQALELASLLDQLTRRIPGPKVPFERPYRRGSRVFYRYGSFDSLETTVDSVRVPALRAPNGELVPDIRDDPDFEPPWASNPFPPTKNRGSKKSAFRTRYLVYEAVTQRGKGGVYRALCMDAAPMMRCVIKEGRRNGETDWDGTDGRRRVLAESEILGELAKGGVSAPEVFDIFTEGGNLYLALEDVGRMDLEHLIRESPATVEESLLYAAKVAGLVSGIHECGLAWRDCKPRNVVVGESMQFYAIDFEGACRIDAKDALPWGSETYLAPEWSDPAANLEKVDLFALGVTCYQILAGGRTLGMTLEEIKRVPLGRRRRHIPPDARRLVASLLDHDPKHRPSAFDAAALLDQLATA
ncbi:protein kinase [Streptomyces sp. NPDC056503]|uniref:class III lanthionine synthetase LanKC N-terminal domain-containing protein n=1 Tax=Streptomyces sp. NPDC056503 TaxID=3345842 RepID=UPI0036A9A4A6